MMIVEKEESSLKTDNYLKEAFWGVIGHDTDEHDPQLTPDQILDLARRHLIDPNFDDYISLYEVFSYFGGSTGSFG